MTISWLLSSLKLNIKSNAQFLIVLGVFLFGILMEILQKVLTISRQADVFDVFANTSGIMIAYIVFEKLVFNKFKDFLSRV
jgi:glycopeptide antibiotics resistance protein